MDEETEVELALEEVEPERPEKASKKWDLSPVLPVLRIGLVSLVAGAFLVLSAICAVEAVRAAINEPGSLGTLQRVDPAVIAAAVPAGSNEGQYAAPDSDTQIEAAPPAAEPPAEAQDEDDSAMGRMRRSAEASVKPYFGGYDITNDDTSITVNVWKDTYTRAVANDRQNGISLADDKQLSGLIATHIDAVYGGIKEIDGSVTLYFNLLDDADQETALVSATNDEITYSAIG